MRSIRVQRLIAATVLVALSGALSACGTNGAFDPTDMLDFLDTKKKLPGTRKPVFPDGVPGVDHGVPKELYKGAQQPIDQPPVVAAPPPAPEPQSKRGTKTASRTPSRGAPAEAPPEPAPGAPGTSAVPVDEAPNAADGTAAAAPPPAPKRTAKRRSITAPPPDAPQAQSQSAPAQQQSSGGAFPAPLPSGGFQR